MSGSCSSISTLLAQARLAVDRASRMTTGNVNGPLEETPMPTTYGRQCIIALAAATLLVACKPKESTTDTTSAAGAVATGSDSANRARTDTTHPNATANANANEIGRAHV